MGKSIALFVNGEAGIEITRFLVENNENIEYVVLSGIYPDLDNEIIEILKIDSSIEFYFGDIRKDPKTLQAVQNKKGLGALVSVYWPYIIPSEVFENASVSINFHPALLPLNRGWYPHVHNIINETPAGVTLHKISNKVDQGDIWAQKSVEILPWENAKDVYTKLQMEIIELFKQKWNDIVCGNIVPIPQDETRASYHSKSEIDGLNEIYLQNEYRAKDLINLLRARTFGNRSFAYFIINGKKIKIGITLEPDTD